MARLGRLLLAFALVLTFAVAPSGAVRATGASGPIQLGGDDQNDHGTAEFVDHDENVATPDVPATKDGWRYIMLSLKGMLETELRAGVSNSIAVIGTNGSEAYVTAEGLTANDGGVSCTTKSVGDLNWTDTYCAVEVARAEIDRLNGLTDAPTVTYYETAAEVNAFFNGLAAGTVNVAVIYLPGDGGTNDIGEGEDDNTVDDDPTVVSPMEQALLDSANDIALFNAQGGGVLASGEDHYLYWLKVLLPTLGIMDDPSSDAISMTADGADLWPGLTDTDISSDWHNHFTGDLGALKILGLGWTDWNDLNNNDMIDAGEATALNRNADPALGSATTAQTVVIIGGAAGGAAIGTGLPETNREGDTFMYWLSIGALLTAGAGLMLRGRKTA